MTAHPFHAIADLAAKQGMDQLVLKVANGGDYVRLVQNDPPVFFKYKPDPSDSLDRANLNDFKRLTLSEEDCSNGPKASLALVKMLLDKFADYAPRSTTTPKSGR